MAIHTAKPANSKAAKPQAAAPEPASKSEARPNSLLGRSVTPVTADMRRAMIAEAAYYIAQQRGFAGGGDLEDWLLAEKQIDAALSA